ncbi:MAG: acetate--CoA ligase family protein [Gaiellaceae bacterium]
MTDHNQVRALLFPRSVAIVGASPRHAADIESVVRSGIPAWGVHPSREEVLGLRCFPSVGALPETPELAALLVGHERVEAAAVDALEAGVRALFLPGLGNEAGGSGPEVAARIAAAAALVGAAVLGPNCMGVAVPEGLSLWIGTVPDTFRPGRVSVVTQSGSIGEALLGIGPRVGFRAVVSCGGEAITDAADLLEFFAHDDATATVGLFLETVRRPDAFAAALHSCAEAEKAVVCLKVGRSRAAAQAALAHTGAVVGSRQAFSALLRRHGAIEVEDFTALVETLEVLGRRRRPRGLRVVAVSESGGEGALLADHAEDAGMPFEPLPETVAAELVREFPNFVSPGNPLDAWAIDEAERVYPRSLRILAESGAYDILIAQADQSQFRGESEHEWCFMIVSELAATAAGTHIFPAVTTVSAVDPRPEVAEFALAHDVALLRGPGNAMHALAAAARWRPTAAAASETSDPIDLSDVLADGPLPEFESALILERYGVPVVERRRAASAEEAEEAARELGFPVVVKADGPAHKAAANGVVLGLGSPEAARDAAEHLGGRVLVARQAGGGPEIFCGMTRDPDYGPVVAVGPGGRAVEALSLAAVALAPIGFDEARALVASAPGLQGLVGEASLVGLARTLVALGRLSDHHPEIVAVDVNPLIAGADGIVAVDALVVVERGGSE